MLDLQTAPSTEPVATYTGNTVEKSEQSGIELDQARNAVKLWCRRVNASKLKFDKDFKRMKKNMEFVYGLQWDGQTDLNDDRYVAHIALRLIQQKVATLYAKNPTAVATRRPRLDYQIWDEEMESLTDAVMQSQVMVQSGLPLPMEVAALFADYQHGKQQQKLVDKFCKTFEIVYGYQIDASKPEFKEQVKQAVRRAVITGVAYARPIFCRDGDTYQQPFATDTKSGVEDRVDRVKAIVRRIDEEDLAEDSPEYQNLRSLMASLGASQTLHNETSLPERLEFDFPGPTSIIPDPRCRNLVDFVAARWIAQEYILPVAVVNEIFEVKVETGSGDGMANVVNLDSKQVESNNRGEDNNLSDPFTEKNVILLEIFDYTNKTRFFIVDGWKDYVQPPEPVTPNLSGFWNHFALVFNNTEVDPGSDASIFPPSDVQTLLSAAKEWNRTRQDLRDHRRASCPRYVFRAGSISPEDVEKIAAASPNTAVELKTVQPDMPLDKVIMAMPMMQIDAALYDTSMLEQDLMLGANMQQANIGPAQPNVTATVGNIAEQSRMNVSASNVDDLDGWLSRIAQAGGEMCLQEMSVDVVKQIAGLGAVWPDSVESRRDFLNEVFMAIQAASSGRPNKAVDIQNYAQIAPLLQAAGANPIALVEEGVKRLDDSLNVQKFFPVMPTGSAQPGQQGEPTGQPSQGGASKEPGPPKPESEPSQGLETTAPLAQ